MFHLNVTILKMDKILFSPNSCTCIRVSLTDSAARIIFYYDFFPTMLSHGRDSNPRL